MSTATKIWSPGSGADTIMSAHPARVAKRGMQLADLKSLGILPAIAGGAPRQGYHVAADVVTRTADGRDLNVIWQQFMTAINAYNAPRQRLIDFLTFRVTSPVETVVQPGEGVDFEKATEFGEPVGSRIQPAYFNMGYTFDWWDLGARYTWQYLADATEAMVASVGNAAFEAASRLTLFQVLKTIFNSTNLSANIQGQPYTVYKFYNNDGTVPPTYKNNTFLGTHNHYKTSGAATVAPDDLDVLIIDDLASHGYTAENGYELVLMVNTAVGNTIRGFVAGTASARYSFVPALGQPGVIITPSTVVIGQQQASPTLGGLTRIGTYGPLSIVTDDWLPTTHMFAFATGGTDNLGNPVGFRQHANPALQGLRLVAGRRPDYPLVDSFWNLGFGTGIRQRGGGIVIEITTDATYDPPAIYA